MARRIDTAAMTVAPAPLAVGHHPVPSARHEQARPTSARVPASRTAPDQERDRSVAMSALIGPQDRDVQEIVHLLHNVCDVEIAAVGIPHDGHFHYLVTSGIDPLTCATSDTICQHTMDEPDLVVVPDTLDDPRFRTSPFVDGRAMRLRFYASAPIWSPSGTMAGRLCLFDTAVKDLDPVQRQALSTLADNVSSILDLRLRKREAAQAPPAPVPVQSQDTTDEVVSVASQVSHDLRVPLTALATSLGLLEETMPASEPELRRKLLASARRSTDRMAGLVDGLLRLNDVQRGLDMAEVDLLDATQQVLTDLDDTLRARGATVTVGDLPTVRGDSGLVQAALLNLVTNAVKFARPGHPPIVRVLAERREDRLRVVVRDNGIGIAPADRERVFGLFSRLTDTPGHGIGLTTVARVAQAHGGRAGVDDTPDGVGSDIWFELPA